MKLLFDQNISHKLVNELEELFPDSSHVRLLGLHTASDEKVWNYARDNGFTIVTQDSDFNERSLVHGYPPKVIWLRTGNTSTRNIKRLLKKHRRGIFAFEKDKELGCLVIY
jgi:predicted nuclease of predicted toxin-antitoxin system